VGAAVLEACVFVTPDSLICAMPACIWHCIFANTDVCVNREPTSAGVY
jgi:hypothetical protein